VTGGSDLSLMEVNEASSVIQEAAHEDANIIFGAVVDPALSGKVKITVIATGFDRKAAAAGRSVPAAALPTPTDLANYTMHLNRADAPPQPSHGAERMPLMREAVPLTIGGSNPLTVQRRSSVELHLPLAASGGGAPAQGGNPQAPDEFEGSPLDVPAFLRRQN